MRTTEENIVYQLLDSIRAAELNNDEVVGERYIRSLLRAHRATLIDKISLSGQTVQEICFQQVPLVLAQESETEFSATTPPVIQLDSNFGLKLTNAGHINIPIVSEESYRLSMNNPINRFSAKAYLRQSKLYIYIGQKNRNALNGGPILSKMIDCLQRRGIVYFSAILDNPDDGKDYNWTTSQYPFPPESIEDLKSSILKKDFNLVLQTKSDQVPNMKNDTLRYHDQGKVQE